jgi:hypothetical protein
MPVPSRQGTSPTGRNRISDMSSPFLTRAKPEPRRFASRGRRGPSSSRAPSIFWQSSVAAATHRGSEKLGVFAFAIGVLVVIVGGAFAAGYLIGRILL